MTHKKHGSVAKYILFQESGVSPRKCLYFGLLLGGGGCKSLQWGGQHRGWEGHWALHYIHVCKKGPVI